VIEFWTDDVLRLILNDGLVSTKARERFAIFMFQKNGPKYVVRDSTCFSHLRPTRLHRIHVGFDDYHFIVQ
jgi:hypothetical protein